MGDDTKTIRARTTEVKALVLSNDGTSATLKPDDGSGLHVTMYRDRESRAAFLKQFPVHGSVTLERLEDLSDRGHALLHDRAAKGDATIQEVNSILRNSVE